MKKFWKVASIAFIASISVTVLALSYRNSVLSSVSKLPDATVLGISSYIINVTVISNDLTAHRLIASARILPTNNNVKMRFSIAPDFSLERSDAIIENGTIVGATPLVRGSIADAKPGMRGLAVVRVSTDGELMLTYLLIGDPFPRP